MLNEHMESIDLWFMFHSIGEVVRYILCRISESNDFLSSMQVAKFLKNSTNLKLNGTCLVQIMSEAF